MPRRTDLSSILLIGSGPIIIGQGAEFDYSGTQAARALKDLGARDIYVCATHALLSGPAIDRLKAAPITEIVVTDSIALAPEKRFDRLTVLSVGELLAKAIRFTHSEQSVSSLFD